jgi:hypothetical protein
MATHANGEYRASLLDEADDVPARCVIVVDEALPAGLAANAAAVLALTLGARAPGLRGADIDDADGVRLPGLIDRGLPILTASAVGLAALRSRAVEAGVELIGFPRFGQETTDYEAFRAHVARTRTADLAYLGLLVAGPKRAVNRLTGSLPLLR